MFSKDERILRFVAELETEGKTLNDIRKLVQERFGVRITNLAYNGREVAGRGAAAKRRLRQMERGAIPRVCKNCPTTLAKGYAPDLCPACLLQKWG